MPTTARHFVFVFRACNAISPLLALWFCGCAVLFGEKHSLVTTVQAQSSSPARFKATLSMSTRYVEFNGFQVHPGKQRLRITVINRGRSAFVIKHGDQNYAPVTPGIPIEIYSAELPNSTNSLRFPLSGVQNRTPCEFQVEVSNPTQFRDAIKVYVFDSSAPM
ncbi:MAG: hypothetical protein JNN07_21745 [Verrucomicrobiales bacterium]|nr:hypothetical protein [Verrucomicrobiales bacterium]